MKCPSCAADLPEGLPACSACSAVLSPAPRTPPATLPSSSGAHPAHGLPPVSGQGEVLCGRYRLQNKLGEGGMGTVYAAHDLELDRLVAVKLLPVAFAADPEVMERFEREARLTARLDHPNIVPIYDVGRHEGRPFIVMKRLEGDTLAGVLRARGDLNAEETMSLFRQLGEGLDFIHSRGFIHRDIKTGNIVVGPFGHATILDFGILRTRAATKGITRDGMVMGTPHYMAPEQALGLSDVDHRADLYALGVVLYECLTGSLPFEAESELRVIQMQAHEAPPDLLAKAPWAPAAVADVVRRALAKRPEDRFPSGAELARALQVAFGGMGGAAGNEPHAPVGGATSLSWRKRVAADAREVLGPNSTAVPVARSARKWLAVTALALLSLGVAVLTALRPLAGSASLVDAGSYAGGSSPGDAAVAAPVMAASDALDAGAVAEVEVVPDAGPPLAARPPGQPKRGRVNIVTTFQGESWWAELFVDGAPRGRTPKLLELAPGRYVVRVQRPGYRGEQREILVAPGKASVVRIALVP